MNNNRNVTENLRQTLWPKKINKFSLTTQTIEKKKEFVVVFVKKKN